MSKKVTIIKTLLLAVCCWLVTPVVWAVDLSQVKVDPTLPDNMAVELVFDGPVAEYHDRLHYQPDFLQLRIPGAGSSLALKQLPIKRGNLRTIEVNQENGALTVTLNLNELSPYQIQRRGNSLFVRLGTAPAAPQQPGDVPLAATGAINRITAIEFRRGPEDAGQLVVNLQQQAAAVDLQKRGQKLQIEFHATDIQPELLYVMDVTDFGTPVQSLETFQEDNVTRLELTLTGKFDYRYEQLDKRFVVDILPPPPPSQEAESRYQGRPISLNFQDIPVRTVLQLIADFNDLNLVAADTVQGNITLRLEGVPWEQALDIILKIKGLDKRLEGNILMVAPAAELAQYERAQLENRQQVAELAPVVSEFLQINYAKAQQLAELLKSPDTSLLSDRGRVSVDERTNTLLVMDTADSLNSIKRLIRVLDIPVKQVAIEARMVTVNDSVSEELGIRWGLTDTGSIGSGSTVTSGSLDGIDSVVSGDVPDLSDRLNVNLPVTDPAGSIAFQVAKLADGRILDLELSALELENKAEIIASPRITTANQKEAYIEQGVEIPYVESSSSGATSVTFKKAVLSLQVTPQITPDNKLILDLVVTQDTQGDTVPTAVGNAVAIDTQRITTQVLVDNGDTVVLGGIFQQQQLNTVKKVPLLGDLPAIGALFRSTSESNQKRELLIFVTPRIVVDSF